VDGYMTGLHTMLRGSYPTLFSMGELRGGLLGDGDDGKEAGEYAAIFYNKKEIDKTLEKIDLSKFSSLEDAIKGILKNMRIGD